MFVCTVMPKASGTCSSIHTIVSSLLPCQRMARCNCGTCADQIDVKNSSRRTEVPSSPVTGILKLKHGWQRPAGIVPSRYKNKMASFALIIEKFLCSFLFFFLGMGFGFPACFRTHRYDDGIGGSHQVASTKNTPYRQLCLGHR